ncbi:MAG: GTP cyclohydrolase I FolE [Bdellovibrionales bacterium]|nr:GTP cyclohydrolase I FolE [Bdellovibrionales bacterium]
MASRTGKKTITAREKKTEEARREVTFEPEAILAKVRPTPQLKNKYSEQQKIDKITVHFREIMGILGLDLRNDSLERSPERVARMYVRELFQGLDSSQFPKITVIENEMQYDQMIVVRDVAVLSTCEHHFVTIDGKAHIAYIPNKRVIGLSKINRIAKFFARRPQVQERLTKQIADCLSYVLDTEDVAVYMDSRHYCVISRGIEDVGSSTITCDLRGSFRNDPKTRSEFMAHCHKGLVIS